MDKIKIAMVGCGGIANYHADHLLEMEDVKITAVTDPVKAACEKMSEKVGGATIYGDYQEMFAAEKQLDAVYICIPPDQHGNIEVMAAEQGYNLFVEKPIALNMETVTRVETAIEKNKVISAVGFQDRYLDIIDKASEFIKDEEVGLVYGSWIGGIPGVAWWRKKAESGGQLVEQNIHLFDMLRYFFGEATEVFSVGQKGIVKDVPGYDVEDYSATTISFENGVLATLFTGCYLSKKSPGFTNGLTIIGKNARLEYDLRKSVRVIKNDSCKEYYRMTEQGMTADRTFIDAVKTKDFNLVKSPYADAAKSLKLVLAANESMESKKPVSL